MSYVLAPDGGFEAGAAGWTLKGASVVAGNEPYQASGSHALALSAGDSATSPPMCVGITHPTVRFFAVNKGFLLSTLKVDAVYVDANNLLRTLPLGVVTGLPGWKPTLPMIALGDLVNPLLARRRRRASRSASRRCSAATGGSTTSTSTPTASADGPRAARAAPRRSPRAAGPRRRA